MHQFGITVLNFTELEHVGKIWWEATPVTFLWSNFEILPVVSEKMFKVLRFGCHGNQSFYGNILLILGHLKGNQSRSTFWSLFCKIGPVAYKKMSFEKNFDNGGTDDTIHTSQGNSFDLLLILYSPIVQTLPHKTLS